MKKRIIIIFLLIITGVAISGMIYNFKSSSNNLEKNPKGNENVLENEKQEEINDDSISESQSENSEKEESQKDNDDSVDESQKENTKNEQFVEKQTTTSSSTKKITQKETKPSSKTTKTTVSHKKEETTKTSKQDSTVSVSFYESITKGKKEFSSESEAFKRGTEIMNKELEYVLDYNEAHPDKTIEPDINYFRVYPSVIDENGKYWYYLHFFCRSGENNDEKLKKLY